MIDAATALFLEKGYVDTTLADVAAAADVGARTVYVRFGTKVDLFKRVIDVAIAGDTDDVAVIDRDWMQDSMTLPTLDKRMAAMARGARSIMERTGALFGVAQQAAAVEPVIAEARHHGRLGARADYLAVLEKAAADKLIKKADVERLADSFGLVAGMDMYLLGRDLYGWGFDAYEEWLRTMLTAITR